MLGSNSESTSNNSQGKNDNNMVIKNSPSKNETSNKKSTSKSKNSPVKNMKSPNKHNSPNKPKGESSKRLRTIDSFLISLPKSKKVKNQEKNEIDSNVNDNNKSSNETPKKILKKEDDEDNLVILIENNEKSKVNDEVVILDDDDEKMHLEQTDSDIKKMVILIDNGDKKIVEDENDNIENNDDIILINDYKKNKKKEHELKEENNKKIEKNNNELKEENNKKIKEKNVKEDKNKSEIINSKENNKKIEKNNNEQKEENDKKIEIVNIKEDKEKSKKINKKESKKKNNQDIKLNEKDIKNTIKKEDKKDNFKVESDNKEIKEQKSKSKKDIKYQNNNNKSSKKERENIESEDESDNSSDFDSDLSIDTLSSFSSSDLSIDSEVESRLNSRSSSILDVNEENKIKENKEPIVNEKAIINNKKKNSTKENQIEKSNDKESTQKNSPKKTKSSNKNSCKKDNAKKESKKEKSSKKDDVKKIEKKNKKNNKKDCKNDNEKENKKVDKKDNEKNNDKKVEKSEKPINEENITVQNNISTNNKNKNKMKIDEIPDNEIVELKNKRVIFHEKKVQIDTLSETLIELLCFHEYKNSQTEPISKIPERFNSLIAKLVQDSDATENNLINSVYQSLSPTDEDDEDDEDDRNESKLLKSAVLQAIRNVSIRKNYGIEKEKSYYPNLAIFRWEVKNLEWLPKNIQEKIKFRRLRRERASEILKKIVDNMSEDEKNNLFRGKKRKSLIVEENKTNDIKKENNINNEQKDSDEKNDKKVDKNDDIKNDTTPKENEKRKIDQLQGQRSIAGFFSPIKKKKVEEKIIPETIQEKQNMEFDNRFKSFYIKSNTKIAPLNYFQDIKVEYNFDDNAMDVDNKEASLENYLSIIRQRKMKNLIKKRKEEKEKLKMESDIIDLTEGGVIPHYKMKLFQFFENHRPAYYGTWRKNTKVISGRHPFKKDTELLDYDFDSEIEWVADEEGEECLSDEEDEEEDIIESQYEQGDDDGWLVPHGYLSDDEGVEEDIDKVNKLDKKNDPKPMKVVPLIPVIIGPIYAENSYDEIPQDANLAQYTVQLIDEDMNLPLDPFKKYPSNDDNNNNSNEDIDKKLKIVFPEEHLSIFVKIVQYSLKGMIKIIDEAKEMKEFKNIPKIQIEKKLREIAVKEKPEGAFKSCWCVKDEIYKKLNIPKPEIPESLKIENAVTSPKKNKSIFKNIKSPSNSDKKKPSKEPILNFLPQKKNTTSSTETDKTIIID
jgi:hypothetical protein